MQVAAHSADEVSVHVGKPPCKSEWCRLRKVYLGIRVLCLSLPNSAVCRQSSRDVLFVVHEKDVLFCRSCKRRAGLRPRDTKVQHASCGLQKKKKKQQKRSVVCLFVCLFVCLSVCLFFLPASLPACLLACLPACLPVCLFVCLSVCLSVCLFFFVLFFLCLFANPVPRM